MSDYSASSSCSDLPSSETSCASTGVAVEHKSVPQQQQQQEQQPAQSQPASFDPTATQSMAGYGVTYQPNTSGTVIQNYDSRQQ